MARKFETFLITLNHGNVNEKIATYALEKGYIEVDRSAPTMAKDANDNFFMAVTATFIENLGDLGSIPEKFETFLIPLQYSNVNEKIAAYTSANGYCEVNRSAPVMAKDKDENLFLAITVKFHKNLNIFNPEENSTSKQNWISSEEYQRVHERCYNADVFDD